MNPLFVFNFPWQFVSRLINLWCEGEFLKSNLQTFQDIKNEIVLKNR